MKEYCESPFLPLDITTSSGPDHKFLYQRLEETRRILINSRQMMKNEQMDRCFETSRQDLFACQLYLQRFYGEKEVIPVPYVKEWDQ